MLPAHVPSGTLTLDAAHVVAMTGSAEPVDGLSVDVVASVDTVTHTPTGTLVLPTPKDRFEVGEDGTLSLSVAATTSDEWNVSGWHYRVRLRRPGLSDLTVRVQVSPGETVSLGEQFALKPIPGAAVQVIEQGKGDPGDDGHSPVVSMVGDQVAVDGVIVGPHLTGKPGGMGSLSIGSVTSGDTAAAVIQGEAPAQVLDLTIPKGSDGKPGPANTLSIGSVTSGATAGASITGTAPSQTLNLTLPQGSPGPKGDSAVTASTVEIRGTGSPYGVVTPPAAGTYYTDTAGTNGAWRWIATGTTRESWVVVHGDTGRRNVSADVVGLSSGNVYVRRVNNWVTVDADDAQWGNLTSGNPIIPLTKGFGLAPEYLGAMFALAGAGTAGANQGLSRIDKSGGLRFSDAGRSLWLRDTRTWSTLQSWPATLPGVPGDPNAR